MHSFQILGITLGIAFTLGSGLTACATALAQPHTTGAADTNATPVGASGAPVGTAAPVSVAQAFLPEQMAQGRKVYGVYCTRCHGINMVGAGAAFFDLRTFPADSKERFLTSVNNGLRAMPAWKEALQREEIEALWAYVIGNKPK